MATLAAPATSWSDVGLVNGRPVVYEVEAFDRAGARVASSAKIEATPEVQPYCWFFRRAADTVQGWRIQGASGWSVSRGALRLALGANQDPSLWSPDGLNLDAASYPAVELVLRHDSDATRGRLSWKRSDGRGGSVGFDLPPPGEKTRVEIEMTGHWTGLVSQLRIDPVEANAGAAPLGSIELHEIRCVPAASAAEVGRPLVGAIRWDGWFPNNTAYEGGPYTPYVDPSIYTDYDYREPFYGWYEAPGDVVKPPHKARVAEHRTLIDQQILLAAAAGLDYWAFVWYEATDPTELGSAFADYQASPHRELLRYALIAGDDGNDMDAWEKKTVPMLLARMKEPQYLRLARRPGEAPAPVLFWFGLAPLDKVASLRRLASEDPGVGDFVFLDATYWPQKARTAGMDVLSAYGPCGLVNYRDKGFGLGFDPATFHHSYTALMALERERAERVELDADGAAMLQIPAICAALDHRAFNDGGTWDTAYGVNTNPGFYADQQTYWFDDPTYSQWERHLRETCEFVKQYPGRVTSPGSVLVYAWNHDEAGPGLQPTRETGTQFLDAVRAVRTGDYPDCYVDLVDDTSGLLRYEGEGWSHRGPAQPTLAAPARRHSCDATAGFHHNSEHVSAVAGDRVTLTWPGARVFEVVGATGPERGSLLVDVNGVRVGEVDLWSAEPRIGVTLWKSAVLNGRESPTLGLTVGDGGVAGFDLIRVTCTRDVRSAFEGEAVPARVWAEREHASVSVGWDAVVGATGYEVQVAAAPGDTGDLVPIDPDTTGFVDEPGAAAWYRVRATTPAGTGPWTSWVTGVAAVDLCQGASVTASDPVEAAVNIVDRDPATAWLSASSGPCFVEVDFGRRVTFNRAAITERGRAIEGFDIEFLDDEGMWALAYRGEGIGRWGNATGHEDTRRSITFGAVSGSRARLVITEAIAPVSIAEFGLYLR